VLTVAVIDMEARMQWALTDDDDDDEASNDDSSWVKITRGNEGHLGQMMKYTMVVVVVMQGRWMVLL